MFSYYKEVLRELELSQEGSGQRVREILAAYELDAQTRLGEIHDVLLRRGVTMGPECSLEHIDFCLHGCWFLLGFLLPQVANVLISRFNGPSFDLCWILQFRESIPGSRSQGKGVDPIPLPLEDASDVVDWLETELPLVLFEER